MGVVYAGHDERLDRAVAIKTVRAENVGPEARERLKREARIAASVNHPNICQLYEIGEDSSGIYIAMELLEGEALSTRIGRSPLPVPEALDVARGMLSALGAMHRRGLIHRDLKPSNIFLTEHGVKLLDFGLARPAVEQPDQTLLTTPGVVIGTPHYMSPEQASGQPVDSRSDLFAVGATLYEMLSGRQAFTGPTAIQVLHAVIYEQPPVLAGSPAIVAADRVINRALAKQPDARYQTAEQLAEDLRAVLTPSSATEAVPARPVYRLIVLPFRVLRPDPDVDFLSFSLADAISTSLSGLGSVVVRSSLVAAKYATEVPDLQKIAREADVDEVLSATLLRAGDRMRVSSQLVGAPDGRMTWSQTFDVGWGDIFQLQDSIVRTVVDALAIPLNARELRQLGRDVPANDKAYEHYLRALELSNDAATWPAARDLYLKCVELDPRYAPAWAQLGRIYRVMSKYSDGERAANMVRAEDALKRALEISPDLPIAHSHYALLEVDLGRAVEAMARLLRQARERPADPNLFTGLCHTCRYCGLLDASIAAHERARRLDPKIATSIVHTWVAKGDHQRVADMARSAPFIGAMALIEVGRQEEAHAMLRELAPKVPPAMRAFLEVTQSLIEGRPQDSVSQLREVIARFNDPEALYYAGRHFAHLGAIDDAIANLARAVEGGYFCYPAFMGDAWLENVRGRPAFEEIVRRAEERHHAAVKVFLDEDGDRLLGVQTAPGDAA